TARRRQPVTFTRARDRRSCFRRGRSKVTRRISGSLSSVPRYLSRAE
ncbi:unnamed protein product, partial [Mycena citricolor]